MFWGNSRKAHSVPASKFPWNPTSGYIYQQVEIVNQHETWDHLMFQTFPRVSTLMSFACVSLLINEDHLFSPTYHWWSLLGFGCSKGGLFGCDPGVGAYRRPVWLASSFSAGGGSLRASTLWKIATIARCLGVASGVRLRMSKSSCCYFLARCF